MLHRLRKHYKAYLATLFIIPCFTNAADQPTTTNQNIPIVLVHGILADRHAMKPTEDFIRKHIGNDVYIRSVRIGLGKTTSFCNMYDQVEWLKRDIEDDPKLKDGFHMIAHSQGGLVGRYYIERYNNPRVYTYISLGSPQRGVFGTPGTLDERFLWLNYLEKYASKLLYTSKFQRYISFASYWCDTAHYKKYLKKCKFLPYLNNEIDHPLADLFKRNLTSLERMVLVKSTKDDIIEPVDSCHFGYYQIGSSAKLEDLFYSEFYWSNRLGLRTLAESGRLHLMTAHCTHANFQEDEQNFIDNILPFLKPDDAGLPPAHQPQLPEQPTPQTSPPAAAAAA